MLLLVRSLILQEFIEFERRGLRKRQRLLIISLLIIIVLRLVQEHTLPIALISLDQDSIVFFIEVSPRQADTRDLIAGIAHLHAVQVGFHLQQHVDDVGHVGQVHNLAHHDAYIVEYGNLLLMAD